ncbi:MAG: NUDIX domain-containing protein [Chloroflexota bacterium]
MSFMRLGTRIAVIDDDDRILLSKRGDFGIWALPGGRVDSGELLMQSAVREVREETGLQVEIVRAVGLYYQQGRSRMNVLYRAKPVGGDLFTSTDETLDNRFFSRDEIPQDLFGQFYIDHAYTDEIYCYTVKTSQWELLKIDLKLRWRWLQNLLAGRPEPKFNQFTVRAVALIWDNGKIYVKNGILPTIHSDGQRSLTDDLSRYLGYKIKWQWVGVWQETTTDSLEFVFHAEYAMPDGQWLAPHEFDDRYQKYSQPTDEVWQLSS